MKMGEATDSNCPAIMGRRNSLPEQGKKSESIPIYIQSPEQISSTDIPSRIAAAPMSRARELKSEKIVDAWDKVGVLTNEMTLSVMKKQADFISKRYRTGENDKEGPLPKKQRSEDTNHTATSLNPEENWSKGLTRCVDRMARMSKLIMEIQYCHRLLREEMVEVQKDLCS